MLLHPASLVVIADPQDPGLCHPKSQDGDGCLPRRAGFAGTQELEGYGLGVWVTSAVHKKVGVEDRSRMTVPLQELCVSVSPVSLHCCGKLLLI